MGNFDRYSNKPSNAPFTGITFGFGSTILEVELNEMQQIQNDKIISLLGINGDCVIDRDGFSYDGNTLTINTKIVKDGIMLDTIGATLELANGQSAYISSEIVDYTYSDVIKANGNTNGETIGNTIMDDRGTNETTRRKGYRFTINTESGMLLGTVIDNKFICLAQDHFSGIRRHIVDNVSVQSKIGGVKLNRIYGKSEQKQYSGKNLLNPDWITTKTENGVTIINNGDNSWEFSGNITDTTKQFGFATNFTKETSPSQFNKAGYYTISANCIDNADSLKPNNQYAYMNIKYNGEDHVAFLSTREKKTNQITEEMLSYDDFQITSIGFLINAGCTIKTGTICVQIEYSETATEFEPYVGCVPSPSPNYPQEIESVLHPAVACIGKNFISTDIYESTSNGVTWNINNGHITASGTPTGDSSSDSTVSMIIRSKDKYTLSLQGVCNNVVMKLSFMDSNYVIVDTLVGNVITFDTADYEYAECLYIKFYSIEANVEVQCDAYLQLERGDTNTQYEPYVGGYAQFPYSLNAIPVEDGGNVVIDGQQYISDYIDFDKRKLVVNVFYGILADNIDESVTEDDYLYIVRLGHALLPEYSGDGHNKVIRSLCSRHITGSQNDAHNNDILGLNVLNNTLYAYLSKTAYDSISSAESEFMNEDMAIAYQLATPEIIDLTDDDISQLSQLKSYSQITNIFTISNELNSVADVEVSVKETGAKALDNENKCNSSKQSSGVIVDFGNAGYHNSIYRGKDLTNIYSIDEICSRIQSGTFEDMYIGDYFDITISTSYTTSEVVRCILAGFDIYLGCGDTALTRHHAVIVPKNCFTATAYMNSSNITTGGYTGSSMYKTTLPVYKDALAKVFGSHLLMHRSLLTNATNSSSSCAGVGLSGASSGWAWFDTYLRLMSEVDITGATVCSSSFHDVGEANIQLPLFRLNPSSKIAGLGGVSDGGRQWYWEAAVASSANFCHMYYYGNSDNGYASATGGVRPRWLIG